jgi:hypothetical protein
MTLVPSATTPTEEVGTPKWWLRRLELELTARTPDMDRWRALVDGDHPLVDSPEKAAKFTRMAGLATTNLCGLAVEATAERMVVKGVRIGGEPDADGEVWDDWQRSDFDAGSQEAITAALWASRSFVSVSPPNGAQRARLHYEDPRQVVLAYTPEGQRAAALKVFTDEWTGDTFGTLYLPDVVVKMVRRVDSVYGGGRWLARPLPEGDAAVVRNPFGEVPFFELENKLTGALGSEVGPLETPQALLNQTMFNIEAIAEYGAFRQKWATGIEVPRGPDGTPINPYEAGVTNMFIAKGDSVRFGDFTATDLSPHLDFAQKIAEHMARLARLPLPTFVPVANVSAEALAMMMAGLKFKCWRRVKGYEPAIEGAVRLMMRANADPRADVANIEVDWAEMETFSMAQAADAAVKLTSGDDPVITPQTAQERFLGMSQTERDRDNEWRLQGRATSDLNAVLAAAQAAPLP